MSNFSNYNTGKFAEYEAMKYLASLGYKIVCNRFKTVFGEIDIIAHTGNILVFCEVKSRYNMDKADIITRKSMSRISDAGQAFLAEHVEFQEYDCRFDCIFLHRGKIEHIINAWE